jgi:iron complex outermembrane receptor protein
MKLNRLALQLATIGLGAHLGVASAQGTDPQRLERVEITGSSIKRLRDEGALPVQVIRAADLVRQGITSAEQLVATLASNGFGIDNMTTNQGGDFLNSTADRAANNGAAGASLRGLGAQYTLVLLNGRRVSTHGLNGKSVDLNSIPLSAVDRVEILKDGASAIYGTDAIGGVMNFILRKNVTGLEASVFTDRTEQGHGDKDRASVLLGAGSLDSDGFNLMASLTYDTNDRLRGSQRSFHNGNQPERGLSMDTTGSPYANIGTAGGTAIPSSVRLPGEAFTSNRFNLLSIQGKCDTVTDQLQYRGDITGFTNASHACAWDYGKAWSMMQPVDRTNLVSRASFKLGSDHMAYVELVASRTKSAVEYTPIQLTALNLPTTSPYYQDLATLLPAYFRKPTDPVDARPVFDATRPERVRWRCMPCGPRQQDTTADASRALAALEGVFGGWDYKVGLSTARSKVNTVLGDGMMFADKINEAFRSGKINPFLLPGQQQTPEALQLIEDAKARGKALYGGQANVRQLDATVSGELMQLPAGALGAAFGIDIRKEDYRFREAQSGEPAINGVGAPASLDKVDRSIKAVFAELSVPVIKDLELQLAVRHDKYDDFGGTTNPKLAMRWQPAKTLGFRASYSTGFHAPDFGPLYGGDSEGQFNSDINDPVLCPNGVETVPGLTGCGIRPLIVTKSNRNLKPEKAKQLSLGVLAQPVPWMAATLDFWTIELTDRIGALSGQLLVKRYDQYKNFVIRNADGEIDRVEAPFQNLAGDKLSGIDLGLSATTKTDFGRFTAALDGTYTRSFRSRFSEADPWVQRVGEFGDTTYGYALHLRWKHQASLTWADGPWSATLSNSYSSGYKGEVDGFGSGVTPPNKPTRVSSYSLYHLSATYTGFKDLSLTVGVKNLLDTEPPFSAHNVDSVAGAGWDARVADPRMRSFTLRASYKFW